MPLLTPQFVGDLEFNLRVIQETEYLKLASSEYMWWNKITQVIPSATRREIITWIMNTAQLESTGLGGNIAFDDMYMLETEFVPVDAGKGIKVRRKQFEDLDGNGVNLVSAWVAQMGAQFAYWPQKQIAALLLSLESVLAYDKVNFFSTGHPLNPFFTSTGFYANLFTGTAGAGGANANDANKALYPGAVPLDTSVSPETALNNLARLNAYVRSIKMPNGSDPRRLRIKELLVSPGLEPRAQMILSASFLATVAGSAAAQGGSSDITGFRAALGNIQVTDCDELSGNDYYVIVDSMGSTELKALAYVDREPFTIRYYTGRGGGTGVDASIDRADELEWHASGRNVAAPGHPHLLFKGKAT